jgi:hypothetical protein
MRALGERNDIIRRIHRGLAGQGIERSVADFALECRATIWMRTAATIRV